jgi:molybdopterin-guanine dinucleotide biosynthesis protein B
MILGLAGWSGSGKTTLVSNLIPELKKNNVSVSTLKHAHKGFDIDTPGKDSYVHRESGAKALMHEYINEEINLNSLIKKLSPVDLILVEGWKKENIKKIEIYRKEINKPLLYNNDINIVAIATNDKSIKIKNMTILDLNNYEEIAKFICNLIKVEKK